MPNLITAKTGKCILTTEQVLVMLLDSGALILGESKPMKIHEKHSDAPENLVYANIRREPKGVLSSEQLRAIGRNLALTLAQRNPGRALSAKYVVGLPQAGEPLADGFMEIWPELTDRRDVELIYLKKVEGPGFRRIVRADDTRELEPNADVIMVDDVCTHALTKIEGADALREMGLNPICCVVYLDREQGGRVQIEAAGVKLFASITLTQAMDFLVNTGRMTPATRLRIDQSLAEMAVFMAAHPD